MIKKIYEKFPTDKQKRYDALYQKLSEETLSKEEHKELQGLNELSENFRNEWAAALIELAQLRGVSIFEVKKQLGIEVYDPTEIVT